MKMITDALAILENLIGDDPETRNCIAEEASKQHIARLIYAARTGAGLTQTALARRIGTSQPVIARLEDADYQGHSLTMLRRIADALDMEVEVSLKPKQEQRAAFVEPALASNIKFTTQTASVNREAYGKSDVVRQSTSSWTQQIPTYRPVRGGTC